MSICAKEALERGGGRACIATHANGCRHLGILDLYPMDLKTYTYYMKPGGWLFDKACNDCQSGVGTMVVDKVTKNLLRYCEMGLKLVRFNKMGEKDDKESFNDHDCSMVLCIPCWNKKVMLHEKEIKDKLGIQYQRCSARKRM